MATDKPRLGTYTDEETIEKFKVVSEKNSRSMSKMIDYLVKKCIEEYERVNGKITLTDNGREDKADP